MVHMHKWLVAFPGSSLNNVQISITTIFLASAAIPYPSFESLVSNYQRCDQC